MCIADYFRYALVLVVNGAHECCCWWEYFVYEDEDSLLWRELNPFPDYVYELADC